MKRLLRILLAMGAVAAIADCGTRSSGSDAGPTPASSVIDAAAEARDAAAELADAAAEDAASDAASDAAKEDGNAKNLPGTSEGCPEDMVLVHGDYCPNVDETCAEHHPEYKRDEARKKAARDRGEEVGSSSVSERCLDYQEPTKCLSKTRTPLRFCMDRYEWPNKKGELPLNLVSWLDAKKQCEGLGKRLCGEHEFNFACEGEAMLPYVYGYKRDATKCNIDKPYRKREHKLLKFESCMKKPACKAEFDKLDQRLPAGSMPGCVSAFGVYDLNGNINEWVVRPKEKPPTRSGLKGGWWGPARSRCRPTVGFHKEDDYGYEVGFRCCKDAEKASP